MSGATLSLRAQAGGEGFFDLVFGTNCFTAAVQQLAGGCNAMDSDQSYWLAFRLANCHLAKTGRAVYTCPKGRSLQDCTSSMSPPDFVTFTQFLHHVHSVCLFVENTDFNRRAENLLSELYRAGADAAVTVHALSETLLAHGASLDAVGARLEHLRASQAAVLRGVEEGLRQIGDVAAAARELESGVERAASQQATLLSGQKALEGGLEALHRDEWRHANLTAAAWTAAEEQARRVATWQAQSAEAQARLLAATETIVSEAAYIQAAVSAVEAAQEQSAALLVRVQVPPVAVHRTVAQGGWALTSGWQLTALLGSSFSWSDSVFYVGGLLLAVCLGAFPATASARLPAAATLLLSLLLERSLVSSVLRGAPASGAYGEFQGGPVGAAPFRVESVPDVIFEALAWWRLLLGIVGVEGVKGGMRAAAGGVVAMAVWHSVQTHRSPEAVLAALERRLDALDDLDSAVGDLAAALMSFEDEHAASLLAVQATILRAIRAAAPRCPLEDARDALPPPAVPGQGSSERGGALGGRRLYAAEAHRAQTSASG